jgi:ankyrin repeat protein
MMLLLLDNGANVNEKNKFDGTALQQAAEHEHMEAARLLVDHGAVLDEGDARWYPAVAQMVQEVNEQRAQQAAVEKQQWLNEQRAQHAVAVEKQQWLNQMARNRPKPVKLGI